MNFDISWYDSFIAKTVIQVSILSCRIPFQVFLMPLGPSAHSYKLWSKCTLRLR